MSSPNTDDLDSIIAAYLLAIDEGQNPDPAEWLVRHPGHVEELARFFQDLGRFGTLIGFPLPPTDGTTLYTDSAPGSPSTSRSEVPQRFAEYELLEKIGEGGMGAVYRARLGGTGLVVALKCLRVSGSADPEGIRRFREEVENVAGLRHPNIVSVYHFGEYDGHPFYTMTLIEGGSLHDQLARFQGDYPAIAHLLATTARAVHYAHQRRVLHRDLKPRNILLDADCQPHVADFGLAARLDDSGATTSAGPSAGSLPWMAPETLRDNAPLTTVVDVWALGVIFYELLTGTRPFSGNTWQQLRGAILDHDPVAPRALNPRLPRDLEAVCLRCLHKNPARRYESAIAVALDLERWLRDEPVRPDTRPTGRVERTIRWCKRNPALLSGAAALFLIFLAATVSGLSLVRDQRDRLREATSHANAFAARHVAATVHRRLEGLVSPVVDTVNEPALRNLCTTGVPDAAAVRALRSRFEISTDHASSFATITLYDSTGKMAVHLDRQRRTQTAAQMGPLAEDNYRNRDYYQGALRHLNEPLDADRVHFSRVFRSTMDNKHKFAISCAVRPLDPTKKPWVLSATVTTDATLGRDSLSEHDYTVVLLAPLDTNPIDTTIQPEPSGYVILVHPGFAPGDPSVALSTTKTGPVLPVPTGPELKQAAYPEAFPNDIDYEDPVIPQHRWLTASARISNTEFVIQVQQRYDVAVAPYQTILRVFLTKVAGAVAIGFVLFLLLRWLTNRRVNRKKGSG